MKTILKRALSVFLVLVLLGGVAPIAEFAEWIGGIIAHAAAKPITQYKVGDIIEFGTYPQSEVEDKETIDALEAVPAVWQSYGYMSGSGTSRDDGSAQKSNYMQYCDVSYGGNDYRGVKFSSYRAYCTNYKSTTSGDYTYQDDNGYVLNLNTTYWFRYDPLQWRVLDPSTGLVLCEYLIDSQPFSDTLYMDNGEHYKDAYHRTYANNYYESSLRQWLNDDFLNTAFIGTERAQIQEVERENKAYSSSYSKYDSKASKDKITLLTYADMVNTSYRFSSDRSAFDINRRTSGSDYAKCQGLAVTTSTSSDDLDKQGNKCSHWWLRSASYYSINACNVNYDGYAGYRYGTDRTFMGVRPALQLNLKSVISQSINQKNRLGRNGEITLHFYEDKAFAQGDTAFTDKGTAYSGVPKVTVRSDSGNVTTGKTESEITLNITNCKNGVTLKKSGYYDYKIPYAVLESIYLYGDKAEFDAYLRKMPQTELTRPYISTVFARPSGKKAYTDLLHKSLSFEESILYDVLVTTGNTDGAKNVSYSLYQDASKNCSLKNGSLTGTELYSKFSDDTSKAIYAYVVADGTYSRSQKVNLKKQLTQGENELLNMLDDGTIKLFGNDSLSVKLSGTGFIDGMEFNMDIFKDLPVGFEKNGNTYRVTFGLDLWGVSGETKGSSTTGTKWKKDKEYTNFAKEIKKIFEPGKSFSDKKEKTMDAYNKAKDIRERYDKKAYGVKHKDWGFTVEFLGYWEFDIVNRKIITKDFCAGIAGKYKYTFTQQGFVWVIPEYTYFTFEASLGVSATGARVVASKQAPMEIELTLNFKAGVGAGGGIGWKDLASAGFWGSAALPGSFNFAQKHLTLDLEGKFGYEAKFLYIFGTKKTLLEGSVNLIDKYYKKAPARGQIADTEAEPNSSQVEMQVIPRENAEASGWLGSVPAPAFAAARTRAISAEGMHYKTLQTGTFEYAQTQIVAVGDKILMVYVEDCKSRDEYNRMRLMSTVYDPDLGTWSVPVAVADDGFNDLSPTLVSDGQTAYVTWQKVNCTLTAENTQTAGTAIANAEIYLAQYDTQTQTFTQTKRLTSDSVYQYNPQIALNNGTPVVYYVTCTSNNMASVGGNNLCRYSNGATQVLARNLNYILQMAVPATGTDVSYLMDADGNTADGSDVSAYTISGAQTKVTTLENKAIGEIVYAELDGEQTLFYSDKQFLYYTDAQGETQTVSTGFYDVAGGLYPVEQGDNLTFIWKATEDDGVNNLYSMSYENGKWTEAVQISRQQGSISSIGVASIGDTLYGAFDTTEVVAEEDGSLTYGRTDLTGFSFTDFTDLKIMEAVVYESEIFSGKDSEFTVTVQNMGTRTIGSTTFTVSDTLGTNSTQTVNLNLAPGERKHLTLKYPTPSNYGKTTLTVTAYADSCVDANTEDNSFSLDIGNPDLYIENTNVMEYEHGFVVDASMYNASDVAAKNATLYVKLGSQDSDIAYTYTGGDLALNESYFVGIPIAKDELTYDENDCALVYLYACDGELTEDTVATPLVLVKTTATAEQECAHVETEMQILREPTYEQEGLMHEVCMQCGKAIGADIPMDKLENPGSSTEKIKTVTLSGGTVQYKSPFKLNPAVEADEGVNYTIVYSSSNPKVASVDSRGNITTHKKGTVTITCTVTNNDDPENVVETTCTVTVKYAWWQTLIRILLLGFLWY